MLKKVLYLSLILCLILFISNIAYASDILMDLNTNTNSANTTNEVIDNTIYTENQIEDTNNSTNSTEDVIDYTYANQITTTTTTDYEDSAELSITNMINIILIVVGVVLVLLGIAIIIKIK